MTTIDPFQVRFSQDTIKRRFRDGRSIIRLAEGLESGAIDPSDIRPIRLVEVDGRLYTLDNRRLEAFRRARVNIPYRMATTEEARKGRRKFSTDNEGTSVRLR